jgi:RimJ/RimL family protein N-acetyltransferase
MPHAKMQEYVNVDWNQVMSIVGLVGEEGKGRIIGEARYIKIPDSPMAEAVFIVDEKYQRLGIATVMYEMLVRLARERGIRGLVAEVLSSNIGMMKVFKKGQLPVKSRQEGGVCHVEISLDL